MIKKLLILFIFLGISVFAFSSQVSAATYTKQPSTKDNFLYGGVPDNNYGSNVDLLVMRYTSYQARPILNFDISDLPAGAVISSAKLYLYYYKLYDGDPVGQSVDAYKVTRNDWVELESTWNIYKTGSNWTTAGGDYVTSNPAGGNVSMPASYGWVEWGIKAIVEDAIANVSGSVNVIVRMTTEGSGDYGAYFHSSDYTTDTSLRPKLVITYTVAKRRIFISLEKTLMKSVALLVKNSLWKNI